MYQRALVLFAYLICLTGIAPQASFSATTVPGIEHLERLPVQHAGRFKPLDSLARESLTLITGGQTFNKKNPTEIIVSWVLAPEEWLQTPLIKISHAQLRDELGLPKGGTQRVSVGSLRANPKLMDLVQQLERERGKGKLSPLLTQVNTLQNQLFRFAEITTGHALRIVGSPSSEDWKNLAELTEEEQDRVRQLFASFINAIPKEGATAATSSSQPPSIAQATAAFNAFNLAQAKSYPKESKLKYEVLYNQTHPFWWGVGLYFVSGVFGIIATILSKSKGWQWSASYLFLALGLAVHCWGMILRMIIAGRPPVTNMFESVIWVSAIVALLGLIFELIYRRSVILASSGIIAGLTLLIAKSAPAVLDPFITPLEPVLRSNYWLTVHVLTITASYGSFALALGIGNVGLWAFFRRKVNIPAEKQRIQMLSQFMYRVMQVGVVLLTAGTILGGIWADYSWGRFWGWDPKETWALIALLGYLAVLHGRFAGWLKQFGFFAGTVAAFALVVMAWYGVNFVLGVGLHSYGFAAGGVGYVTAAVLMQFAFIGLCAWRSRDLR